MKPYSPMLILAVATAAAFGADLNRGRQLYNEGKYSEASRELQAVVRDNSDSAEAHRLLGMSLVEQDRLADAEKHLTRAMELDASGETKLALAKLSVARKDYDRADQLIGEASGDELEHVRGLVHFHKGRYEEAARDLEAAIDKRPGDAYAHYYAGLAYSKANKPDRMLTHFEMFVKMKPDAPEARKVRAVLKTGR